MQFALISTPNLLCVYANDPPVRIEGANMIGSTGGPAEGDTLEGDTEGTGAPATGATGDTFDAGAGSILRQPMAVWATAGASVVACMGIGLVDPILPSIAKGLD